MKKEKIFVRAAEMFDIPSDTRGGLMHIEMTGNREIFFENHKGIITLGKEEVEINSGEGTIVVYGTNLRVVAMNSEELRLSGRISNLEFRINGGMA